MTKQAAIKRLIKEVEFLGYRNLGELVEEIKRSPLAFPLGTMAAYRVYMESL
jgi:hypothetical protein